MLGGVLQYRRKYWYYLLNPVVWVSANQHNSSEVARCGKIPLASTLNSEVTDVAGGIEIKKISRMGEWNK